MSKETFSNKQEADIFIVEDHPIFRGGLVQLINNEEGLHVVGEAEDYAEGLKGVRETEPDIVIVDITLKSGSGIELIKDIRRYLPDMKMLALSMHDENIYAERVLKAGAMGYLMKQEAPETVIAAIEKILDNRIFVSENISTRMLSRMAEGRSGTDASPIDILTDRELEVFQHIGDGLGTRKIAERLGVSIKTVENHRAHIKEKLGLANSIELIQRAALWAREVE